MSASIRVAHLGNYDPDSADGTEKTIAGLVSWLPRHGVDVEVWQLVEHTTEVREHERDGVRIFDLPAHARPAGFLRGLTPQARSFVERRQSQIDVMHFHSAFIPENSAVASLLKVPYVITPNGGYSAAILQGRHRWFKTPWLRLREAHYVRRAATLQAVSAREGESLRRLFAGLPVVLVHNALSPSLLADGATRAVGDEEQKDLLYLGRLAIRQKGLDRLLRGYARFLEQTGDRATRLVLVGPDYRGGRARLELLARSLNIADRLAILDPAFGEDKWTLLRNAYAFVHTSRYDGLPFSVLEALAASRPVLVTPGTNLAELVQSYGAGIAVTGTSDDIARGIHALTGATAQQYAAMSRQARQLAADHFTWPEAARRMASIYGEVCAAQHSTAPAREPSLTSSLPGLVSEGA